MRRDRVHRVVEHAFALLHCEEPDAVKVQWLRWVAGGDRQLLEAAMHGVMTSGGDLMLRGAAIVLLDRALEPPGTSGRGS